MSFIYYKYFNYISHYILNIYIKYIYPVTEVTKDYLVPIFFNWEKANL